jgi:hypothetical protein
MVAAAICDPTCSAMYHWQADADPAMNRYGVTRALQTPFHVYDMYRYRSRADCVKTPTHEMRTAN